jgi:enoyl ACP reductase
VILEGKRILVTGVVNRHSIAYCVAEQAQLAGAEVLLTSFGRVRSMSERAAKRLPKQADVLELDVNEQDHFGALRDELRERWGGIDGAVHAIAFAPPDALGGEFLNTPRESATAAFETSAFSLKALAEALLPLYTNGSEPRGGSLVGLDFDASRAWPAYDWMGVSKAALEPAASGIPGFSRLKDLWGAQAPLGWDVRDPTPVAQAIAFLLSDMSRGISGEILHVDGGFHAMGAPLSDEVATPE